VRPHPSIPKSLIVTFKERYMAESFIDSRAMTPLLQKFKFAWYRLEQPPNADLPPSATLPSSDTTNVSAAGASTGLTQAVGGTAVDGEDKDEEPQDLDVADEDDDIWRG
jgi:hypothetical protein